MTSVSARPHQLTCERKQVSVSVSLLLWSWLLGEEDRVSARLGDFAKTSPSPTLAGPRLPGSHSSDISMKSWQQTWAGTRLSCGHLQPHLLFVHPSFLPAFLGSSSTPRLPSPCSFLIYALGVCQPRPGGHCWMLKDLHKICKHTPPLQQAPLFYLRSSLLK